VKKDDFHWTETEVFRCLASMFASPAYVWIPQVRNGTGFTRSQARTIDALGVSVWPSRGLYFMGVEIKVRKSDWRKELGDGKKADDIAKYCRQWYVAAPRGVIPLGEVPANWGLIECPKPGQCEVVKAAVDLAPQPPDMLLVCAVLRQAAAVTVPADDVRRQIQDAKDAARVDWVPEDDYRRLSEMIEAFEAASGLKLPEYSFEAEGLGRDVALLRTLDIPQAFDVANRLITTLEKIGPQIRQAMAEYQAAVSHTE